MNIGLVLSGGMAKGAYQIGALKALNEFIPLKEIKYISCASVGVLNGYAYATGNLDGAEHMWKNICVDDTRLIITQMLKSSMLQQNIKDICMPKKIPESVFYCSLFDWSNKNIVYKDLSSANAEQIPKYLKASVAMPIYNHSVRIDGTAYFDGALVDNIPVYPLLKHNLDYIICIYFDNTCYKFESTYFNNKVIKIFFPCDDIVRQSLVFRKDNIENMIKDGYDRAIHIFKTVFCEGFENLNYIYRTISYMNETAGAENLRITGDMLITNLNRITQKLTRKKVL